MHGLNAYAAHRDGDGEKVTCVRNRQPRYPTDRQNGWHLISSTGHGLRQAMEGKFSG
jgi:hypothetical protein